MIFPRQWFSPSSQIGLTSDALMLENIIISGDYARALEYIQQHKIANQSYWQRQELRLLHLLVRKPSRVLKLYYDSFWPDMVPENCQLTDLFRQATSDHLDIVVTSIPEEADISLYSCYGQMASLPKTMHTYRIIFLGENVRPSFSEFDLSLTSDLDSYCERNIALPLWMFEIDWFGRRYSDRCPQPLERYTEPTLYDPTSRIKAIAFIGNNHEPYRISLINQLTSLGFRIDRYGSQSSPVADKEALQRKYRAVLCPENSFFPGYVTEKLLQAYLSGAFSIYSGCLDSAPFNANTHYVNLSHLPLTMSTINQIRGFMNNEDSFVIPPLLSWYSATSLKDKTLSQLRAKLSHYS